VPRGLTSITRSSTWWRRIAFILATVPFGAALLFPSIWLLFRVFKAAEAPA
jgi:hypothetical protein